MNIKKEIMEEFRKKFVMKSMYGNHINFHADPVLDFLSQALTRIEEETMEKALWCQFCGDELSCFGCEGIPGRTMEENRKLLLASLPPSEEKEVDSGIDVTIKEENLPKSALNLPKEEKECGCECHDKPKHAFGVVLTNCPINCKHCSHCLSPKKGKRGR